VRLHVFVQEVMLFYLSRVRSINRISISVQFSLLEIIFLFLFGFNVEAFVAQDFVPLLDCSLKNIREDFSQVRAIPLRDPVFSLRILVFVSQSKSYFEIAVKS
jgi:hypothetical protein